MGKIPEGLEPSAQGCPERFRGGLGSIIPPMLNRKIKRRDPVRTGPRPKIQTGLVTIATAAAAVSTTAAASRALFTRLGHVDRQGAAAQL